MRHRFYIVNRNKRNVATIIQKSSFFGEITYISVIYDDFSAMGYAILMPPILGLGLNGE
jgi:hypothetical protein